MYDLTLTAIAFLGFGTFVMNLVMDAMAVSSYIGISCKRNPNNINYIILQNVVCLH